MTHNSTSLFQDSRLVVVIDGAPTDVGAAAWTAEIARKAHAAVDLVYALPATEWSSAMAASLDTSDYPSQLRLRGERRLAEALTAMREIDADIEVESKMVELPSAKMAQSVSDNASLMIFGAEESGPLRDIVFGHATTTVVKAAKCPTLVWRPRVAEAPVGELPIVVGVDGSDPAKRALAVAFDLAHTLGLGLMAVHIGAVHETGMWDYGPVLDWQHLREAERKWLQDIVDPYRDDYPSVPVQVLSTGASAARGLRDLSTDAEVLVVGSRGRGRLSAAVLGSVSQNLIHHADCPVLVVH